MIGAPIGSITDKVLRAGHIRMGALFNVLAGPKPVKERLVGLTTPSAASLFGVFGSSLSAPHVVGNDRS